MSLKKSSVVATKESVGGAADRLYVLVVAVVVDEVLEDGVAAGDALHIDPRPVVTIIRYRVNSLLDR